MEELNNNLQETTMEVLESKEVIESIDTIKKFNTEGLAVVAVIATGLVAGAWGLKKLVDRSKAKKLNNGDKFIKEFDKVETVETSEEDETFI